MENKNIRTRFAPSPTGLFHIGSARTALFSYLFAKKNQGQFFLRIEDTDQVRSEKKYEEDIITGLKWLGLDWDNNREIYYQTAHQDLYKKYADKLISLNAAYEKDGAIWFNLESYKQDKIVYDDLILGKIEFNKDQFHDFVLIKSNGIPLYQFACVVDDYEMKLTHIIRGADHINSTPQQIMLYTILDLPIPHFAHIPLILNADKSKMSKRKNPVSITQDFKNKGYLPEAMINYITFLGWNPKNNQEFFNLKELEQVFDLKKVNKSGAVFDLQKLDYFNNHYIKNTPNNKLLDQIVEYPENVFIKEKLPKEKEKIIKSMEVIKPRLTRLTEFAINATIFFSISNYPANLLIFKKSTKTTTLQGLKAIINKLENNVSDWSIDSLNNLLLNTVKEEKLTNGDLFWPIRVALSGEEKSPSPVELLWVLEKKESLIRLHNAITKLEGIREEKNEK